MEKLYQMILDGKSERAAPREPPAPVPAAARANAARELERV